MTKSSKIKIVLTALALTAFGNPANMGFCIACFLRDIAGATKLQTTEVVQYVRPEIIGIVLGAISIKKDHLLMDTAKAGFVTSIIGTVISLAAGIIVYALPFIDLSVIYDFLGGSFLRH